MQLAASANCSVIRISRIFCEFRSSEIEIRIVHDVALTTGLVMAFALRLHPWYRSFKRPAWLFRQRRRFWRARHGGAAVEFAIIGPVLLVLLSGIFTYGGYFLTAHTVQQLANDAARAAIAGLDDDERLTLARDAMAAGIADQPYLRGELAELSLTRAGSALSLRVTYDASEDMYWAFSALLPTPSPSISRIATIRMGGL